VTIIVVLDSPHGPHGYYGGNVSAPVFKHIAEATLRYLGVGPTIDPVPPILVPRQPLRAGPEGVERSANPVLTTVSNGDPSVVPDLYGLSAREAVRRLVALGLTPQLSGDGFVTSQNPSAGTPLEAGGSCRIVLSRWATSHGQDAH